MDAGRSCPAGNLAIVPIPWMAGRGVLPARPAERGAMRPLVGEAGGASRAPSGEGAMDKAASFVRRRAAWREPMKGRIAIIDDNEAIVEMLRRKLEKEGFEVLGCSDSAVAVELCRRGAPDLIVLDILMPGKNGWEIMEELKGDPATGDTPVIISTVKNRPEDLERGRELRASDYIAKPYVFGDLLEKINHLLSG